MRAVEQGPIFIGGPDRCGKTTLRAFLASHPRIAIPAVGSNMWTYFYGQYGDLSQPGNFERCLEAMLRYKHVRFLQPDAERIRREFWQGDPSYARLFSLFVMHFAEREGKPRWGVQTGLIERYAAQIFEAYPGVKMLHMVRDPRDRYHASLTLWPDGRGRAGGAAARWLYSARLAKLNLRRFPGSYMVVRYESMVSEPEKTLRAVCDFLGEAYDPAMLAMPGAAKHRERLSQGRDLLPGETPVTTDHIGLFREGVPKAEIAFIQQEARQEMLEFGYRAEPLSFTSGERLRYAVLDWPLNRARMAAWLAVEAVQHRAPGVFGRKPRAAMILDSPNGAPRRGSETA